MQQGRAVFVLAIGAGDALAIGAGAGLGAGFAFFFWVAHIGSKICFTSALIFAAAVVAKSFSK
jgi:hypothetical protein